MGKGKASVKAHRGHAGLTAGSGFRFFDFDFKSKIMRKIIIPVLLSVNLLIVNNAAGQNTEAPKDELPSSTIHFLRSGKFMGSACRTDITLPNQREFNLSLGSLVNYKIYSQGEITVTLGIICPGTQYSAASSSTMQLNLKIESGKDYYVLFDVGAKTGGFKEVKKEDIQSLLDKTKNVMKQEENLDQPISRASLESLAERDRKVQGTCFLLSVNGYLITNYHVIRNAKDITIKGIDGDFTTKYGVSVVGSDPSNDLALLKIGNKNVKFNNPPFAIRSS